MKKILTISTLSIAVLAGSCSKEPLNNLTQEESRIYITNHNDSVNFQSFKTFSIADSVAVIENGRLVEKATTNVDAAFIAAVKQQMQQRGFTLVNRTQSPDLGINVNRVYTTSTGIFSYNDYWGGYGGYWDPYYWGYPGYGYYVPSYGVYQSTEGALSIDIIDLKDAATNQQLKGIWSGLIRGSGIFNANTAGSQVKALFDQSAYLQSNQ
jgi:hypothetical protein